MKKLTLDNLKDKVQASTKETVIYKSKGMVYGNLWGGGEGAYPSITLQSNSKDELIKDAESKLDGSLDGGMGFESLIGALLNIETITTVTINGKEFINREYELEMIGNLSEKQQDFLLDCYYNS